MKNASRDCPCWEPRVVAPTGARKTIGTATLPPDMYRSLAALLASWSMARNRKSPYCTSATGRKPPKAAPMATPAIAASEIGVSMTRRWPNSSDKPSVTVKAPPKPPSTPMSSPSKTTRSSRSISSRSASRSASTMVNWRTSDSGTAGELSGEDIIEAVLRLRVGALLSQGNRFLEFTFDSRFDLRDALRLQHPFSKELCLVSGDGISLLPGCNFLCAAVVTRIAPGVARKPIGFELEKGGPQASPRSKRGLHHGLIDPFHVIAVHGLGWNAICGTPFTDVFYFHHLFDRG